VQHFHLDVKGTRNLLFSFVHEETGTMYHLDIGEHNFVRQELVAILKRNWPDVLEPFEMKGIQFSGGYTDAEIGAFRKNGGNVAVPTGGDRAVAAIGGGLSTAGIGIQAVRFASWAIRMVADLEDRIRKQEQDLRKALGTGPTAELQFELVEFMPRIVVREQGTGKDVYNQPPQ
jgi:hypothetical protein